MDKDKPFFFYSKSFPEILQKLNCTIAYSTYQAGKVILVSSQNGQQITKYAKNFERPMGIAYSKSNEQLAIASKTKIDIFSSSPKLANSFPDRPKRYDQLYIPQCRYYTGFIDTHEIVWAGDDIVIVNTLFSCLSTLDHKSSFKSIWKPFFISDLMPEDKCHLNGVAIQDGRPAYVTCFSKTDSKSGWRNNWINQGLLINVEKNEIVLDGLNMPHSPTIDDDRLYFVESGIGQIKYLDLATSKVHELNQFDTFLRGVEIIGDYIFICVSLPRENSNSYSELLFDKAKAYAGIIVLDKHTGKRVGGLTYTDFIKEIFTIGSLAGVNSPAILTEKDVLHDKAILTEDSNQFWINEKK